MTADPSVLPLPPCRATFPSREEFRMLETRMDATIARLDSVDSGGTRGMGMLGLQVQELAKDLAKHELHHEQETAARERNRRWLVMAAIAVVAAVDGPVVTVLLARGGH